MDRNLGAMVGEGSFDDMEGLYYTWGRKDPFTAGGNSEKSIYTYNRTTDQFPKFKHPEVARGVHSTIPYYINHPAERFGYDGSIYYANPYEQSIWNDPDWSISAQGGKTKKSFFDPCPPGWRLPESDTWNSVLGHVLNTELGFKYITTELIMVKITLSIVGDGYIEECRIMYQICTFIAQPPLERGKVDVFL